MGLQQQWVDCQTLQRRSLELLTCTRRKNGGDFPAGDDINLWFRKITGSMVALGVVLSLRNDESERSMSDF